ncbi:unnamed protein product, partial [Allacma fusca]
FVYLASFSISLQTTLDPHSTIDVISASKDLLKVRGLFEVHPEDILIFSNAHVLLQVITPAISSALIVTVGCVVSLTTNGYRIHYSSILGNICGLRKDSQWNWVFRVGLFPLEAFVLICPAAVGLVNAYVGIVGMSIINACTNDLWKLSLASRKIEQGHLKMYRILEVTIRIANDWCQDLTLPLCLVSGSSAAVLCLLVSIKPSEVAPLAYLCFVVGGFFRRSADTTYCRGLFHCRRRNYDIFKRQVTAMRKFEIHKGSFGVMNIETAWNILHGIVNYLLLILSLQKRRVF